MKFKGEEFVEFLRRVLDYPRREMINPADPDFADLVNKSVAKACGAKVYLPPETFYEFTTHLNTYPKGRAKWSPTLKAGAASKFPERKKPATWTHHISKGSPKGGGKGQKSIEGIQLGPEKTPLDGAKPYYVGGPFTNPNEKLDVQHLCVCWNRGIPCKYLAVDGLTCRKLQVCSQATCRTLYHHGHRPAHHPNRWST